MKLNRVLAALMLPLFLFTGCDETKKQAGSNSAGGFAVQGRSPVQAPSNKSESSQNPNPNSGNTGAPAGTTPSSGVPDDLAHISYKYLKNCDGTLPGTKFNPMALYARIKELAPKKAIELMYHYTCIGQTITSCYASKMFPTVTMYCRMPGTARIELPELSVDFVTEKTLALSDLKNSFGLKGVRVAENWGRGEVVTFIGEIGTKGIVGNSEPDLSVETSSGHWIAGPSYSQDPNYRSRAAALAQRLKSGIHSALANQISLTEVYDFGNCNRSIRESFISNKSTPYVFDSSSGTYFTVEALAGCGRVTQQGYDAAKKVFLDNLPELQSLDGEIR